MVVDEVARSMITGLEKGFNDFKSEMRKEFSSLKATNEQLYNHLSNRLPAWATTVIAVLSSTITGFIALGIGAS